MEPSITAQPFEIKCEHVCEARARDLRAHPAASDIGFGWLRLAKLEYFPDRVLLVSTQSPVSVTFRHGAGGLEHMRASLTASIYACRNPQNAPDSVDLDEDEEATSPSVS